MHVRDIKISVAYESRLAGGRNIYECRVEVNAWGREPYTRRELIPEDDFLSRFEWMMNRAHDEVKKIAKEASWPTT